MKNFKKYGLWFSVAMLLLSAIPLYSQTVVPNFTAGPNDELEVQVFISNPCDGLDNGEITFTVIAASGGTATIQLIRQANTAFNFLLTPPHDTDGILGEPITVGASFTYTTDLDLSGLEDGNFGFSITDGTFVINEAGALDGVDLTDLSIISVATTATTTDNTSCAALDGQLEVLISGGSFDLPTGSISYTWSADNGFAGLPLIINNATGVGSYTANLVTDLVNNGFPGVTGLPGGQYTITINDDFSVCNATLSDATTLLADPSPSDRSFQNPGARSVCSSLGTSIVLQNSESPSPVTEPDIFYQLQVDGTDVGAAQIGNGGDLTFNLLSTDFSDGSIITIIASQGFCTPNTMSDNVTITLEPLSVADFEYTNDPYCSNEADPSPTFLNGGVAGAFTSTAGLVINGATGEVDLDASTAGTYTVTNTIAASGACPIVTFDANITITALPTITLGVPTDPTTCTAVDGTIPLTFTNVLDGVYSLNSTAGVLSITVTAGSGTITGLSAGVYDDITITVTGCTSAEDIDVTLSDPPVPTATLSGDNSICFGESTDLSIALTGTAPWDVVYTDGVSNFNINAIATSPHIETVGGVTLTTNYSLVSVTDATGCVIGTISGSATVTVTPILGNPAASGIDTWIGYVYDDSNDVSPLPGRIDFDAVTKYRGFIDEVDIPTIGTGSTYDVPTDVFDLNIGLGAVIGADLCNTYDDNFSIRLRMNKTFADSTYIFTLGADAGVLFYIDGVEVLNDATSFNENTYTTYTTAPQCLSGAHELVIEYYETTADARLTFDYVMAGVTVMQSPAQLCAGDNATFTATPINGGVTPTYQWQIDEVDVFGQTANTFITNSLTDGQEVRVVMTADGAACSVTSNVIPIVIVTSPVAPTVDGTVVYCVGDLTITDLTVAGGTDISWYDDALHTTELGTGNTFNPATDIPGWSTATAGTFQVFVTETLSCGESTDQVVTILITDPFITVPATATPICDAGGIVDLTTLVSGAPLGGTFTFAGTGVTGDDFDPTGQLGTINITVDYTIGGCAATQEILELDVITTPVITVPATVTSVCESAGTIDLTTLVSGSPSGGTFTFAGTGVTGDDFDPTGLLGAINVTVDYTVGGCAATQEILALDVVTNSLITVPATATPVCETGGIIDLTTLVSGSPLGGTFTFVGTGVTGNDFDPSGLLGAVNITVDYTVGGCVATQETLAINVINTAPSAPTGLTSSNPSCTSFDLSWTAVTDATSYRVDVATDAGFASILGSYSDLTVNGTSLTITGLGLGTQYFYQVRAVNSCGTSGNSVTGDQTTDSTGCGGAGCFAFSTDIVSIIRPDCDDNNGGFLLEVTSNTNAGISVVFATSTGLGSFSVSSPNNFISINPTGLSAGIYNYEISDGLGNICPLSDSFIELKTLTSLDAVFSNETDIICSGDGGTVEVTSFSVPGPYYYSIDGTLPTVLLPANNTITGLPNGTTLVRVSQISGDDCAYEANVSILDLSTPMAIAMTITPATCNAADGSVNISAVTGGSGNYTGFTFGLVSDPSPSTVSVPFNPTTLAEGDYVFTATDDTGCSALFAIAILGADQINTTVSENDADCSTPDGTTGSIVIGVGTIPVGVAYTLELSLSGQVIETKDLTSPDIGYTFSGIGAGDYSLVTTSSDVNICPKTDLITVGGVTPVRFEYELECIDADVRGLRLFDIQGESGNNDFILTVIEKVSNLEQSFPIVLVSGTNEITIKDEDFLTSELEYTVRLEQAQTACISTTGRVYFDAPDNLIIPQLLSASETETSSSLPDQFTGSMTIGSFEGGYQSSGSASPYLIRIELDSSSIPGQQFMTDFDTVRINSGTLLFEMKYENIPAGRYLVEVVDHLGCGVSFDVRIGLNTDIFIPNIFTPNGDNINESFFIRNLPADGSGTTMTIANRWGKVVFTSSNYYYTTQSDNSLWDAAGDTEGIYFYSLSISGGKSYNGWVEVLKGSRTR